MKLLSGKSVPKPERMVVHHVLKTWPRQFQAIWNGLKYFEFRKDDRGYEVLHSLRLAEWMPPTNENPGIYTGRWVLVCVTHIERGPAFGIPTGYVCMSLIEVCSSAVFPQPELIEIPGAEGDGNGTSSLSTDSG